MIDATTMTGRQGRARLDAVLAPLSLALAVALAPVALADRDLASQSSCLARAARLQSGGEAGRGEALRSHFECFPEDAKRFGQLFEGAGALADDPGTHFTLFFAARNLVSEREWSAKAVGVLIGNEWSPGTIERYALLLRLAIYQRPSGPLDYAGRLDDAELASFWRVLFGSRDGFAPDPMLCKNREELRACRALAKVD